MLPKLVVYKQWLKRRVRRKKNHLLFIKQDIQLMKFIEYYYFFNLVLPSYEEL